jgi:hypothetical protein
MDDHLIHRLDQLEETVSKKLSQLEDRIYGLFANGPISKLGERVARVEVDIEECRRCPIDEVLVKVTGLELLLGTHVGAHKRLVKWAAGVTGTIISSGVIWYLAK